MLRVGMTVGIIAVTRLSEAAVNHEVHPLLEAPKNINYIKYKFY